MTAYYIPQELSDIQVVLMSPQPHGYGGPTTNPADVNPSSLAVPYVSTPAAFGDCTRAEEQFPNQFFPPESASLFMNPSRTPVSLLPENYSQGFGAPVMAMVAPQNLYGPSPRLAPSYPTTQGVHQTVFQTTGPSFFSTQQFPTGLAEPSQGIQQMESEFVRAKRQRDENYRYSLGCISRRVKLWLDCNKAYMAEAQTHLEDQLVRDSVNFDGGDDSVYELFDENRRRRFCPPMLSAGSQFSSSHPEIAGTSSAATSSTGAMSNPFLCPAQTFSDTFSASSPRCLLGSVSVSDDLHGSFQADQEFIVKFPKQIPPVCPTTGMTVQFEELTDRSVLRNWRCRTDDADLIYKKGRKRFFRRVAVLPPDAWQPNKRPQAWEWAPSGPFALHLGEYVSISGTNGYPYEIVLIRHIPPAMRCFLTLVPVQPELAMRMLNGEKIAPQSRTLVVHTPVDSVTHKWILNGFRPRDFTREMALEYINRDIEMERVQKELRKAKKGSSLSVPLTDSSLISLETVVATSSDEDLIRSSKSGDSLANSGITPVVFDCSLSKGEKLDMTEIK